MNLIIKYATKARRILIEHLSTEQKKEFEDILLEDTDMEIGRIKNMFEKEAYRIADCIQKNRKAANKFLNSVSGKRMKIGIMNNIEQDDKIVIKIK